MNDNRILVTAAGGFNVGQQLWEAFVAAKCHKSPSLRWAERSIARLPFGCCPRRKSARFCLSFHL
jgi:hypothetical protein